MSHRPTILENLIIITSLVSFITEEMNIAESFRFDVLESVGLVPSVRTMCTAHSVGSMTGVNSTHKTSKEIWPPIE